MKKLFVMAAMVLSSVGAFAQYSAGDITIQPKVGLNVATVSNFPILDTKNKAAFAAGVEAEYHVNNWLGISLGAMYSQQGTKFDANGKLPESNLKLDYINIPVLANFYVAKGLALKTGIQPGFKVNDKYEVTVDGKNYDMSQVLDGKVEFNSFDFTIPVGISYEYAGFTLDARYNVGVSKVVKGDQRDDDKSTKHEVLQLTLGYKFKL